MGRRIKRRLWMGVALVAVLAGVTAAAVMAAEPAAKHAHHHSSRRHHARAGLMLGTAASYLATTPTQLRSELQTGTSLADIANSTAGKSAQGLIQALEAADEHRLQAATSRLSARITARVERPRGAGTTLRSAAGYLGLSALQLRRDLRSGKSPAQLADATAGKSQAGLLQAVLAAKKAALAADVKAGRITQAHENAALATLSSRVKARLQRAHHSSLHADHRSRSR
ncbi:MAG: hypothetical protein ACRDJX_02795 [Solirubrobacteraceae bacterium]